MSDWFLIIANGIQKIKSVIFQNTEKKGNNPNALKDDYWIMRAMK